MPVFRHARPSTVMPDLIGHLPRLPQWGSTENPGCFCEHLTRFSRKTAEDTPFERRIFLTIAVKPWKISAKRQQAGARIASQGCCCPQHVHCNRRRPYIPVMVPFLSS